MRIIKTLTTLVLLTVSPAALAQQINASIDISTISKCAGGVRVDGEILGQLQKALGADGGQVTANDFVIEGLIPLIDRVSEDQRPIVFESYLQCIYKLNSLPSEFQNAVENKLKNYANDIEIIVESDGRAVKDQLRYTLGNIVLSGIDEIHYPFIKKLFVNIDAQYTAPKRIITTLDSIKCNGGISGKYSDYKATVYAVAEFKNDVEFQASTNASETNCTESDPNLIGQALVKAAAQNTGCQINKLLNGSRPTLEQSEFNIRARSPIAMSERSRTDNLPAC